MTTEFMLMRHAKSDWGVNSQHDFDRPLNKRGVRDATRMGGWLLEQDRTPDVIISSAAVRARLTAKLVATAIDFPESGIVSAAELYGAGLNTLLSCLERSVAEYRRPLIIAHNPTLDSLLEFLLNEPPPYTDSGKLMTTAAIAILQAENVGQGKGKLTALIRPKEF
ncbi:MAG: histidine phosphatase family protein [Thiotrichales bacterium]|nr:histidine phosphatase family protein [Thiotrichales bacterium]